MSAIITPQGVIGSVLTTVLIGLCIGIIWVPVGFWMGVTSVKKVAEADQAEEAPEFIQEAAQARKKNDMALSAKEVEQQYNDN